MVPAPEAGAVLLPAPGAQGATVHLPTERQVLRPTGVTVVRTHMIRMIRGPFPGVIPDLTFLRSQIFSAQMFRLPRQVSRPDGMTAGITGES